MFFFVTPNHKPKLTGTHLVCWRERGENTADCGHIFWTSIQHFWKDVSVFICRYKYPSF